jgi:alpha-L-fucosidase
MQSRTDWLTHDRLGMFIHWGIYSLPARHEWVMSREETPVDTYGRYASVFNPDRFDAATWARAAADAGMRYAVLTTKHHDGYCMFASSLTDYSVMHSPVGRDLVAEFVDAMRSAGLKVGFYYSLLDWHHPDFAIDIYHPLRNREDVVTLNRTRTGEAYRAYLHGQVRELMSNYGKVDYLFFDFSYDDAVPHDEGVWGGKGATYWDTKRLIEMVRKLQPDIIINDRAGLPGDFVTPEQYQPSTAPMIDGRPVVWEANQTLNGSWGYDRDNTSYKSADLLIRMLIDGVSKNGNLLLNVGPNGRGEFDSQATAILAQIGAWMRLHDRSIYGAGPSPFMPPTDARYTQRGDRLYLHLFAWPFEHVHLAGLSDAVEYAQFLHDASEVQLLRIPSDAVAGTVHQPGQALGTLTLRLPVRRPDVAVPVVELFLKAAAGAGAAHALE